MNVFLLVVSVFHLGLRNFDYFTESRKNSGSRLTITGWTVYRENINLSVFCIDLAVVGIYLRTTGFIFFKIDNPTSY